MQRTTKGGGLITPAAYARLCGLNRSTISRQIRDGKIPDHDGLIDVAEADVARERNLDVRNRRNAPSQFRFAMDTNRRIRKELMDRILGHRNLVPAIMAGCGVRDPVLIHCADEVFAALVCNFAGELDPYDWDHGEDIPVVECQIEKVFRDHNLPLDGGVIDSADMMVDRITAVLQQCSELP